MALGVLPSCFFMMIKKKADKTIIEIITKDKEKQTNVL